MLVMDASSPSGSRHVAEPRWDSSDSYSEVDFLFIYLYFFILMTYPFCSHTPSAPPYRRAVRVMLHPSLLSLRQWQIPAGVSLRGKGGGRGSQTGRGGGFSVITSNRTGGKSMQQVKILFILMPIKGLDTPTATLILTT